MIETVLRIEHAWPSAIERYDLTWTNIISFRTWLSLRDKSHPHRERNIPNPTLPNPNPYPSLWAQLINTHQQHTDHIPLTHNTVVRVDRIPLAHNTSCTSHVATGCIVTKVFMVI